MKITFRDGVAIVDRESGDPPARNESHFWFMVRQALNGKDTYRSRVWGWANPHHTYYQTGTEKWIKRPMQADGHLTSALYYVRSRKPQNGRYEALHDRLYAIRAVAKDYNAGSVELEHVFL